jgi:calcineurin-like phosphoesterase family protein
MTQPRFVKELQSLDKPLKTCSHSKKTMTNYLNILEIWDIVEKYYVIIKRKNDNAVNIILKSVNGGVSLLFGNMTTVNEM